MYERVKESFEGILVCELAGGVVNKYFNHADLNPFIHYCDHVVAKVNACVISTYGI